MVPRVIATDECVSIVSELVEKHGPLVFMQSGGCCDGSTPMCYSTKEFAIGPNDLLLGHIGSVPFYISRSHYSYWKHTQLIIDLGKGGNDTFSLTAPDGRGFVTKSRFFTDQEWNELVASAPDGL